MLQHFVHDRSCLLLTGNLSFLLKNWENNFCSHLSFFHHLGLEYFIEIQHNTVKKMVPDYCCLLCDTNIKKGSKDKKSILEVARNHLKSSAHKMKFMVQVATSHCAFLC